MPRISSITSRSLVRIVNRALAQFTYTLDNPNPVSGGANDRFGYSVDVDGDYIIVGAYFEDDATGGSSSGKAYIFDAPTGNLLHTLDNPDAFPSTTDQFGWKVAISGDRAIVSAFQEDEVAGDSSGKAYIFDVTTGSLVHTLDNPNAYDTPAQDFFGYAVDISGNYAIVGAYWEDELTGNQSGKAYIFDVTTGLLVHTLDNPNAYNTPDSDNFGIAVGISGNHAIVGALNEDDASGFSQGKAYIFDVTTGLLVHTLDNPNAFDNGAGGDSFGVSVAIDGNYAIVGASGEDDAGGLQAGKAYIYNVTTGALVHTLDNPNAFSTSGSDFFGDSVDINETYAIVGARQEHDADGLYSGKAYVFDVTTGLLIYTLDNPNAYGTSQADAFGWDVAISSNYFVIGAFQEDSLLTTDVGRAYTFDTATGEFLYTLDNPNAYGGSGFDRFGMSVSVSGNYAIVGASYEDDQNAPDQGKAYIFNVTTGSLVFTIDCPVRPKTDTTGDRFGASVSISGNLAIVGAPNAADEASTSNFSGSAYIYSTATGDWTDTTLLHTLDNPNAYSTSASDTFGLIVAIAADYAVVTAPSEDDNTGLNSGVAYVFDTATGNLLYTFQNPNFDVNGTSNDSFGASASVSGRYAIIGAPYEDDPSFNFGSAYLFDLTDGTLVKYFTDPDPSETVISGNFGFSVAIDGDIVVIGQPGYDFVDPVFLPLGLNYLASDEQIIQEQDVVTGDQTAYSYTTTDATTASVSEITYIAPDNTGLTQQFAEDANIDDDFVDVSPPWDTQFLGETYNGTDNGGGGVFYGTNGYLTFGEGSSDYSGLAANNPLMPKIFILGIDNINQGLWTGTEGTAGSRIHRVVIKMQFDAYDQTSARDTIVWHEIRLYEAEPNRIDVHIEVMPQGQTTYANTGQAYVYNANTGALLHTLSPPNRPPQTFADYGTSVSVSGNFVMVGANGTDNNSGLAYIYDALTGRQLTRLLNPNVYSTPADDRFGYSVSIDSTKAIIGAFEEADANGTESGKSYVYHLSKAPAPAGIQLPVGPLPEAPIGLPGIARYWNEYDNSLNGTANWNGTIYQMAWDGQNYIAAGIQGTSSGTYIGYSADATTWNTVDLGPLLGTSTQIWAMATNLTGTTVVASFFNAAVSTGGDLSSWTDITAALDSIGMDNWYQDIIWDGTYFMMVASEQSTRTFARSTDGINWQAFDTHKTANSDGADAIASDGNGTVVTIGGFGAAAYSLDSGATWTRHTALETAQGGVSGLAHSINYANGLWVAMFASRTLYSTDGLTWTLSSVMPVHDGSGTVDLTYVNGYHIAVGNSYRNFAYSEDGDTWTSSLGQMSTSNVIWTAAPGNPANDELLVAGASGDYAIVNILREDTL